MDRLDVPPDVVIRRLPLYARSLRYLLEEGVHSVSSQELGERINVTAAQIRKDLSYFGEFGKQGIGYDVEKLLNHIERILGLNQRWPVVLVGVGYHYLLEALWVSLPLLSEFGTPMAMPHFCLLITGLGIAIGALGSFISIRRFLKI